MHVFWHCSMQIADVLLWLFTMQMARETWWIWHCDMQMARKICGAAVCRWPETKIVSTCCGLLTVASPTPHSFSKGYGLCPLTASSELMVSEVWRCNIHMAKEVCGTALCR